MTPTEGALKIINLYKRELSNSNADIVKKSDVQRILNDIKDVLA